MIWRDKKGEKKEKKKRGLIARVLCHDTDATETQANSTYSVPLAPSSSLLCCPYSKEPRRYEKKGINKRCIFFSFFPNSYVCLVQLPHWVCRLVLVSLIPKLVWLCGDLFFLSVDGQWRYGLNIRNIHNAHTYTASCCRRGYRPLVISSFSSWPLCWATLSFVLTRSGGNPALNPSNFPLSYCSGLGPGLGWVLHGI